MKFCCLIFLLFACNAVYGEWASRVYLVEAVNYFDKVIQDTFLELEERGFCNLKLEDQTYAIRQEMYKWLVVGNVTYTDGFLVAIQKVDVTDVAQQTTRRTVDDVVQTVASVYGHVNLRNVKIGYDVIAELGEDGNHRFTGTFVHTLARIQFSIQKNLNTQAISVSSSLNSLSSGLDRMIYMPANNKTQVISRTYSPSNVWNGIAFWARDHIVPVMTDIVTNKLEFPPVCLDCR